MHINKLTNIKIVLFKYFLISFCVLVLSIGNESEGKNTIQKDSLLITYEDQFGEDKIATLSLLSRYYYNNLDSAIYYDSLALGEAYLIRDTSLVIDKLIDIGYLLYDSYDLTNAKLHFNKSISLAKKSEDKKQLYRAFTALGIYFNELNVYDSALFYHLQSLKLKEDLGDKVSISKSLNNIGLIYYNVKDIDNAIRYYKRALDIMIEEKDTFSIIVGYHNLGIVHNFSGDYELALTYLSNARKLAETSYKERLPYIYDALVQLYMNLDRRDLAKKYLTLSLELSEEGNNKILQARNYYYLAELEYENGNHEIARQALKESEMIARELADKRLILIIYQLYANIYEAQNEIDSAFYYQKLFTRLGDSIFNEQLAKNLAKVQLLRQAEESQQVIAQKEKDISQRTKLSRLLGVVLLLSVLLIIIVTRNYVQSNKVNKVLSESNAKVEKQKEDLQRKNRQLAEAQDTIKRQNDLLRNVNSELEEAVKDRTKELKKSNTKLAKAVKDLDDFIYKTSHDLRGPIATMQGIIKVGMMETKEEESLNYFSTLQDISNRANRILNKLIQVHEMYQSAPSLEMINLEKSILAGVELAKKSGFSNGVTVNLDIRKKGEWNTDRSLMITIIENMLANAFLFSINKDPYVNLTVKNGVENSLKLTFEDNGFGILDADIDKVFNVFFKGSPRRSGTGLEIYAARIAIEKLKGVIELKKPKDNTIYEITLPSL